LVFQAFCIVKHLSVTIAATFAHVFQALDMVSADHSHAPDPANLPEDPRSVRVAPFAHANARKIPHSGVGGLWGISTTDIVNNKCSVVK
jgi:hypothetical protein